MCLHAPLIPVNTGSSARVSGCFQDLISRYRVKDCRIFWGGLVDSNCVVVWHKEEFCELIVEKKRKALDLEEGHNVSAKVLCDKWNAVMAA